MSLLLVEPLGLVNIRISLGLKVCLAQSFAANHIKIIMSVLFVMVLFVMHLKSGVTDMVNVLSVNLNLD